MSLLRILYGSQTGNAEDLAKRIGYLAKRKGFPVRVEIIDELPLKSLAKPNVIIFVCSTTGHGQEPDNMKNFFNFIRRRDLPTDCLCNLKFAVYGLGDSSYSKFNYVSKIIFKRLKDLGAQELQPLVLGDEKHEFGCDGAVYPMLDELWPKLGKFFVNQLKDHDDCGISYSYYVTSDVNEKTTQVFNTRFLDLYDIKFADCISNERITSTGHFQDTRFLRFSIDDSIKYDPGDVAKIFPCNSDDNVNRMLECLNLNPTDIITVRKKYSNFMVNYLYDFIPDGLSVRNLIKYYLDISAIPRRSFFEFLWPLSDNQLERDKLKEYSTTEGQSELYEYCQQPKRSILEVLIDFPNTAERIKLENLLDIIPPIKGRQFSIASSLKKHPKEIQLIVGVVRYKTRLRKIRLGLCSNYLASLNPLDHNRKESQIVFQIVRSDFKLPDDTHRPIIMVGPGLGIAPMKSFIEERTIRESPIDSNFLYFGCRYESADFYFRDQMNDWKLRLRVAFSREGNKEYVQDLMRKDENLIHDLMNKRNAIIYVAGNSKLPEGLRTVIYEILTNKKVGLEGDQASSLPEISNLEAMGRIKYDCW